MLVATIQLGSRPREAMMFRVTQATQQSSSEHLLPLIASGDRDAVQACIDRYGGLVWSLARRFCNTESDAEDATQDIFLDIWKSASRFDPSVASETTFVAMIARRRLIDRRRKASRRPQSEVLFEDTVTEGTPDWDGAELSDEASIAVRELKKLSEDQQKVLRLSIFQGLTHERIAEATGMPLGTVKTHARRGLIKLRDLLAKRRESVSHQSGGASNGLRLFPGSGVLS
jgi:RNA polymerase sigma factor (sigma-70 family)